MKKILFCLFMLLIFPLFVNAQVNYEITDYYIESHILENGDLEVKELFVMDGTFNGYERDIIYTNFSNNHIYNANGIKDVKIKAKYVNEVNFETMNDSDFTVFELSDYPYNDTYNKMYNGSSGIYIKGNLNGGERYRMYYSSNEERVAFYLSYIIDDVVVIHNDVAELYWNFIGRDFADELENLNIKVYLPESDSSDNFRIWAHGDLTGKIDFLEENNLKIGAIATMDKVEAMKAVDIRMTFNKSLITDTNSLDYSNEDALSKIIEVETERANEANALREEAKREYYTIIGITVLYLVALLIAVIYVVKKFGLDKKSDFNYEYNREFINDYNVEVVNYLINKKNITPDAMSASIMNLIYKKNIQAEELVTTKKKEYKFTLLNENNVNATEAKLIAFLFNTVGKNDDKNVKTFTTDDLKRYAESNSTCDKFINNYTEWKENVIKDGELEGFYEKTTTAKIIGLIFLIMAMIIFRIANVTGFNINFLPFTFIFIILFSTLKGKISKFDTIFNVIIILIMVMFLIFLLNSGVIFVFDYLLVYIALFLSYAFCIYTLFNTKKSSKGALHYKKWMAFKRFLEDFGLFNEKELPEIALWERYLVYATVFGIADKVEKVMNVRINEISPNNTSTYVYVPHINLNYAISRSINSAVKNSYSKQAAKRAAEAKSHSSSGGGFGGGFSSGGGFGGGGGGGRGF